jgi:hypothetical protein
MAKIFVGMIIGSMFIMMLLGGSAAADQVFSQIQQLYLIQASNLDIPTTLLLLGLVSVFLGGLLLWPAKPALNPKQVIRGLRRHCS